MIEIMNRQTGELLDAVPGLAEIAALHHAQLAELSERIEDLVRAQRWTLAVSGLLRTSATRQIQHGDVDSAAIHIYPSHQRAGPAGVGARR